MPNVFEINEDEINKNRCLGLCDVFLLIKSKFGRTSKFFAGPVDPRCNWSYGASDCFS